MAIQIKKATKAKARLRMALIGPAGTGKTYTSLAVALAMAKARGWKVLVVDTERGSASKYADMFEFDVIELTSFSPKSYIEALHAAAKEGYEMVIVDSLSHAWMGSDGILAQVDQKGGKFDAWRSATPLHNKLVDAILDYPGHVIATMRAKTAYEVTTRERPNGTKETVVEKLGLAPQQRDGLEFEFDVVGDLTQDNTMRVSKTRCSALRGANITEPGENLATILLAWLESGAAVSNDVEVPTEKPAPKSDGGPAQGRKLEVAVDIAPPINPSVAFVDLIAGIEGAGNEDEVDFYMSNARKAHQAGDLTVDEGKRLGAIANKRKAALRGEVAA
jgi:hypothetical protein